MRKILISAALLIVALAISMGAPPSVQAATSCTTSCSASTLSCNPVNSCTSVPGTSITCDGVTTTCSDADHACTCSNQCYINYQNCTYGCYKTTCRFCESGYDTCINNCGPTPPNISSC